MKLSLELLELVAIFLATFTVIIGSPLGLAWLIHWGLA